MNPQLEAIKDAWDKTTGDGRDEAARTLADQYVADNPDQFTGLEGLSLEQCVQAVDVFRAAGLEEDLWRVETWLLHRFQPQQIGGPVQAQIRLPGTG